MGILFCCKKKRSDKILDKQNQLILVQEDVDVFQIKKKLKLVKNEIRSIQIIGCRSNRDRFDSVDILLLREDLQVSDFPKLQSVVIDFVPVHRESNNFEDSIYQNNQANSAMIAQSSSSRKSPQTQVVKSYFDKKYEKSSEAQFTDKTNQQQQVCEDADQSKVDQFSNTRLVDKLYEKALNTIQKDIKTHLLLRCTVNQEQLIINQLAFKDKRAFLYVMRKMKQLNCTLKRVIFKDIITLKKNIFITICQQMREIQSLQEIQIINTNINTWQVIQLQHLLCWMQNSIKVFIISGANLMDEHIDILFFQKFRINDFYDLEKLELKNCPQLWKSDRYIQLMKQYAQLKFSENYDQHRMSQRASQKKITEKQQNYSQMRGNKNIKNQDTLLAIQNGNDENDIKSIGKFMVENRQKTFDKYQTIQKIDEEVGKKKKNNTDIRQDRRNQDNQVIINLDDHDLNRPKSLEKLPQNIHDEDIHNFNLMQQREVVHNLQDQYVMSRPTFKDIHQINPSSIAELQQEDRAINYLTSNHEQEGKTDEKITQMKENDDSAILDLKLQLIQEDQRYDNRHERNFIIGEYLWESYIKQGIDDNDQEAIKIDKILQNALNMSTASSQMMASTEKGISQQDNQFFSQFLKSCIRELMEIDLCKTIDFSGFNYQNFSNELKKQICEYLVSSSTIQVFIIEYDRLFFKELCEQISIKYKNKRNQLFTSFKKELVKRLNSKNPEDFNQMLQNPNLFFNSSFKNNLISLESIKIVASKFEQFQFDSFCYISFLSLFVLSVEVDFQNQSEDQIVYPTYEQILEYLKKMVEDNDIQEDQENDESMYSSANLDMSGENNTNKSESSIEENNEIIRDVEEEEEEDHSKPQHRKNNDTSARNKKSISQSRQIYETIRGYQSVFDLSTSIQDLTFKNFQWNNSQSFSKDKSFSHFLYAYLSLTVDSIMNIEFSNASISHTCLSRISEIIAQIFYQYQNERTQAQQSNVDQSITNLNYREMQEVGRFLSNPNSANIHSKRNTQVISRQLTVKDLTAYKTQKSIINKSYFDNVFSKLNSLSAQQTRNYGAGMKRSQTDRSQPEYINQQTVALRNNNIQNEKSILSINKDNKKSKYLLNKFKLKFAESKMMNLKQILQVFGQVCKYVEILNATCLGYQEIQELQAMQKYQQQMKDHSVSIHKMQQSAMQVYNNQGLENPNSLYKKAKQALNNIGQSAMIGFDSQLKQKDQLGLPIFKDNGKYSIQQKQQGQSNQMESSSSNSKNILTSIKLVDYIGFSFQNVVEINNQIESLQELILIRCGLQLYTLKSIMQKMSRFKQLKKLVISGNDFSSISQSSYCAQITSFLKQYTKDVGGISSDIKMDSSAMLQAKKRFNYNFSNPALAQQRTLKQLGTSTVFGLGGIQERSNMIGQSKGTNSNEMEGLKTSEDIFRYCIEKMFQIPTLKYLDLSNNEIDESFGQIILDQASSMNQLQKKYDQQQLQEMYGSSWNSPHLTLNPQKNLNIPSNSKRNSESPLETEKRKSGFYSKFVENQIYSNINQRQGSNKLSKLKKLNTKFFVGNHDEIQEEEIEHQENNLRASPQQSSRDHSFYSNPNEADNQRNRGNNQQDQDNYQAQFNQHNQQLQTVQEMDIEDKPYDRFDIKDSEDRLRKQTGRLGTQEDENKDQFNRLGTESGDLKISEIVLNRNYSHNYDFQNVQRPTSFQQFQKGKSIENSPRQQKVKKEEIEMIPDISELYLQSNKFKQDTVKYMIQQFGTLFTKLKVLDVSAKEPKFKKKVKQSTTSQKQPFNLMNSKLFLDNNNMLDQLDKSKNNEAFSTNSEKESRFENDSNLIEGLYSHNSSIYNESENQSGSSQMEDDQSLQPAQDREKYYLSQPSPQFQDLETLNAKDISWENLQISASITNIFSYSKLQQLDLSGSIDSDSIANQIIQNASNIIACPLRKLNLSRNRYLKRSTWKNLTLCFLSNYHSLEVLNLSDCTLTEDRIKGFLEACQELEKPSSLLELNLSRNPKLEGGIKQFIFVLTQLEYVHLQVLDLSSCKLSDQSGENMIQGLLYGKKRIFENINNYLLKQNKNPSYKAEKVHQQTEEQQENVEKSKHKEYPTIQQEFLFKGYQQSFSLIKLILYDNNISMKMNFLIQYSFIFQISEEDNILFSMHFSRDTQQKKQMATIWKSLKEKKGVIYSTIHQNQLEDYSVNSQTLVLGQNLFSSKKVGEDIIINSLRTFNSIRKLKLFVNEKVVSIMNGITGDGNNHPDYNLTGSYISKSNEQNMAKSRDIYQKQQSRKQSVFSAFSDQFKGRIGSKDNTKLGSQKLSFISLPKTRLETKPATLMVEQAPKLHEMERQHTLPVQLGSQDNQNFIAQQTGEINLLRSPNRETSNASDLQNKSQNLQPPIVTTAFGMKNRLQEIQNRILSQQNSKQSSFIINPNDNNNDGNRNKVTLGFNKQRSRSENKQLVQNQLEILKSRKRSLQKINLNKVQNTDEAQNIVQINNPSHKNNNQLNDYLTLLHEAQNQNAEECSTLNLPVEEQVETRNINENNKELVKISFLNSFTNNNEIHQDMTQFQIQSHSKSANNSPQNKLKPSSSNLQISKKVFNSNLQKQESCNVDAEGNINNIELPSENILNRLQDINNQVNYSFQPEPLTNKKKSIIKNKFSVQDNFGNKQFDEGLTFSKDDNNLQIYVHPQSTSNQGSFISNKQQKKKLTIQEDPQIHNLTMKHTEISPAEPKKSDISINNKQRKSISQLNLSKKFEQMFKVDKRNQSDQEDKQLSFNGGDLFDQELNEKLNNNQKQESHIIYLEEIENLVLSSNQKVGIISILEFFSLVSSSLKSIDFTQVEMSVSMFIKVIYKSNEDFDAIHEMKFANLEIQKSNQHQAAQTAVALHDVFTNPSIEKLAFVNCQFTEELIEAIISPTKEPEEDPSFFVKELNLSKNKNISFQKEENFMILENIEILNLSDCNLNEKKFNLNIQSWKSKSNLENLIDLDLSYNKGLSPKFFCYLGQFIGHAKILKKLDISYTALYEEKQRQFSYGLNYRNGISKIQLKKLLMKQIKFSKKEGTLQLFKALTQLECLEVVDMSDMQLSNFHELDILHNYFRYDYIGKLTRVKKLVLQNCSFLFDTIPYYNFESKFSLLEYNHCSLFLLSQFDNLVHLDLTGCLTTKRATKKFLMELDIMRRKKLFNFSIKNLNISKNLIPSASIRIFLCDILFIFKGLQTFEMRSLVRFEQNYVGCILDALESYSYFDFIQNQNYLNKKDVEIQGQEMAEAFMHIDSKSNPQLLHNMDFFGEQESQSNVIASTKFSFSNRQTFSSFNHGQQRQQDIVSLNLSELILSDISNELLNNNENINMLLNICVANKHFSKLKKIFVNLEHTTTTNTVRLQNIYSESLLEINEKYKMETQQTNLNTKFVIQFKFKDSKQLIVLKPEKKKKQVKLTHKEEKTLKKSIYFPGQTQMETKQLSLQAQQSNASQPARMSTNNSSPQAAQGKVAFIVSFTKMRVEYIDENIQEEEEKEESLFSEIFQEDFGKSNQIKHSHFSITESNEYLFNTYSTEKDEDQIQLWKQFYPFLKQLSDPKLDSKQHISLNYVDTSLKLLSSEFNIFLDKKHDLNTNMNVIFSSIDTLYLGNMLYYFFVQVCQFKPQNDLIDFLTFYLLFISQNAFQKMSNLNIRLPPFLILNEEDASRIQSAFMNAQSMTSQKKNIQNILETLKIQDKSTTISNPFNAISKRTTIQQKLSIREDRAGTLQKNKMVSQVKSLLDKKKQGYQSALSVNQHPPSSFNTQTPTQTPTLSSNQQKNANQNKIVCNYFYKSKKGCEEYDEIARIKKMPPSTLNIDNFSVNGLKAVYMICYHNDYFIKGDIDYESIMFVSTSLAFSLREYFYQQYTSSKRFWFRSLYNKVMYLVMDVFVDIDSYFKYDESLLALDANLERSKKSQTFFVFMTYVFYAIIFIVTPVLAFVEIGPQSEDGLSYIAEGIFYFYAAISFFFEIYYMRKVLNLTRHLIPDINLVHQNNLIAKIRDYIYEQIMNIEIFNYKDILFYQQLIFSFLAQLHAYQDICFIIVSFRKDNYLIAGFSIFIIAYNKCVEVYFLLKMTQKSSYCNLFFSSINTIYEYSQQACLEGLSNILDIISPHNVIRITENFFTKAFFPKKAIGLSINKQIFHRIRKVIGCDLPQITLQLLYILNSSQKSTATVQLSIALNIISLVKSMNVLMTIKQSVLNQMDFDELSEQKARYLQTQFLQYQQKEIEMFDKINNNVTQLRSNDSTQKESKEDKSQKAESNFQLIPQDKD